MLLVSGMTMMQKLCAECWDWELMEPKQQMEHLENSRWTALLVRDTFLWITSSVRELRRPWLTVTTIAVMKIWVII